MYSVPMRLPLSGGSPSPEYVQDCLIAFFGSWENALASPDGRAVIARHLTPPDDLDP
ncbi:hypothetical protein [Thermoactinospora rubra]|uniref:hypothetical protein n=1 Tax=Thermoactinospora rubra TaxID=1088767 RepID=UPI0013020395|nr:hypothetical protein [Thermoactinospora rubra]